MLQILFNQTLSSCCRNGAITNFQLIPCAQQTLSLIIEFNMHEVSFSPQLCIQFLAVLTQN